MSGPGAITSVIIPCLDEEAAIGGVVAAVLAHGAAEVIVVDGGSRDRTVERAQAAGARVVTESRRGYGRAVQSGVAAARTDADILLFIDGDGSDRPELMGELLRPIIDGRVDFVHGTRVKGEREPGSLLPQQIVAGRIAGLLLWLFYRARFTDMSPYRAIRREVFERLGMSETTYGWNLEMLMRVAATGVPSLEIPVGQRRRVGGVSKVTGSLVASARASFVIAMTFLRLAARLRRDGGVAGARTVAPIRPD